MSWVGRDWDLRLDYAEDRLSTHAIASNHELGLSLVSKDLVDFRENVYLRKLLLRNLADTEREFVIFFHHNFHIMGSPLGDTAYYDPDERAIIHYKDTRYFLASGIRRNEHGIDQYATGVKEFRQLEGTWRDAEDGILEGNPISQGSVDSVLAFSVKAGVAEEHAVYYWIVAGKDYGEVSRLNRMILGHGPEHFIRRTDNYWNGWINKEEYDLSPLPPDLVRQYKRSLLILCTNIDERGAILAANDSDIEQFAKDTYSYMWPRDGALTAYALDKAGYSGTTRRFFEFCLEIIGRGNKESVGYFLHKYNPDGSLASSWHPWVWNNQKRLPIQEDGTALVLWALWFHFDKFRDIEVAAKQYEGLVTRCGDFLASYRDTETGLPLPSYDLWEEEWGIHTFTVSAVYAGLKAAENFARFFSDERRERIYAKAAEGVRDGLAAHLYSREEKRFLKTIIPGGHGVFETDTRVDASTYAPFYFGAFGADDERIVGTMAAIEERLRVNTEVGGIARYEGDAYQKDAKGPAIPGNPWIICTLWLAQWRIARSRSRDELQEVLPLLRWASSRALPSGVLAEQINPLNGKPVSVSPLTWSHAAFAASILEYLEELERIETCPSCGMPLYAHGRQGRPHASNHGS